MSYYLYTETAFNHQGEFDYLKKMIEATKKSGAKGIKFQVLLKLNEFMSSKHPAFEQAKTWVFSKEQWLEVFEICKKEGLDVILMPLDLDSVDLIQHESVKYIDIHSVSFNDIPLLEKIKLVNKPIILGVGGRTENEIIERIAYFNNQIEILMMGFQAFPSELKDVKLQRIKNLKSKFPSLIIGYADHTSYLKPMAVESNVYAYLLGARCFEKHITVIEGEERIDYEAAVGPDKIKEIISKLDVLESLELDNEVSAFEFTEKEVIYRNRQKFCVLTTNKKEGDVLTQNDLTLKMVGGNIEGYGIVTDLVGKKINKSMAIDTIITKADLK